MLAPSLDSSTTCCCGQWVVQLSNGRNASCCRELSSSDWLASHPRGLLEARNDLFSGMLLIRSRANNHFLALSYCLCSTCLFSTPDPRIAQEVAWGMAPGVAW